MRTCVWLFFHHIRHRVGRYMLELLLLLFHSLLCFVAAAASLSSQLCVFFYHKLVCFFFSFVSFFLDIGFDLLLLLSVRRRRRRRHRSYLLLLLVITLVSLSFYLLFSCVGGRQLCVVSLFSINYEFGWINFHLRSSNSKFQVKQNVALQLATCNCIFECCWNWQTDCYLFGFLLHI